VASIGRKVPQAKKLRKGQGEKVSIVGDKIDVAIQQVKRVIYAKGRGKKLAKKGSDEQSTDEEKGEGFQEKKSSFICEAASDKEGITPVRGDRGGGEFLTRG